MIINLSFQQCGNLIPSRKRLCQQSLTHALYRTPEDEPPLFTQCVPAVQGPEIWAATKCLQTSHAILQTRHAILARWLWDTRVLNGEITRAGRCLCLDCRELLGYAPKDADYYYYCLIFTIIINYLMQELHIKLVIKGIHCQWIHHHCCCCMQTFLAVFSLAIIQIMAASTNHLFLCNLSHT